MRSERLRGPEAVVSAPLLHNSRHRHRLLMKPQNNVVLISFILIGEGNGIPLQYSCLENPMDGGAW